MKTNTPPKTETQDRIQQLKLGVDWHADHFRVVRMCDGQSPQPAQRFTPASFLLFVQKQLTLADHVFVVYEAGPGGFHLHRQLIALDWTPPSEKFDLVVTNFFLDCFRAEQLQKLVPLLAESTTADAVWLLADFRVPESGWQRWRAKIILALLYAFFKLATSLSANRLTPPDNFLTSAGFKLVDRRFASFGFAHSDFWQRKIS